MILEWRKKIMKKNKESRRKFLKEAATGMLGTSALVAGLGTTEQALTRFLSCQTKTHINDFFKLVSNGIVSSETDTNLIGIFNSLLERAENDLRLKEGINILSQYISGQVQDTPELPVPPLGLIKFDTDALAASYLAASRRFAAGTLSVERIAEVISSPNDVIDRIAPDFITRLIPALQEQMTLDAYLSRLIRSGTDHLEDVFRQIDSSPTALQRPSGKCRHRGKPVSCWKLVVVLIIVIVLIPVLV